MDPQNIFKTDTLRTVMSVIIPGAFATGPYFLVASYTIEKVNKFWLNKPIVFAVIAIIIVLAVGNFMEDLGGFLECHWRDKLKLNKEDEYGDFQYYWDKYIQIELQDHHVGHRYMRNIVTRMYFELSIFPSLILFYIGFVWANYYGKYMDCTGLTIISVAIGLTLWLCWYESRDSVRALAILRKKVIDGIPQGK
jgi:hypothetical protein